jgi:D-3-phosphoglycerate dehydrogenase / 2-oxoglutarate reductase
MAERLFKVLVLNQISANGLKRLPGERYVAGKDIADPDAVLVRSADPAPAPTTSRSSR